MTIRLIRCISTVHHRSVSVSELHREARGTQPALQNSERKIEHFNPSSSLHQTMYTSVEGPVTCVDVCSGDLLVFQSVDIGVGG